MNSSRFKLYYTLILFLMFSCKTRKRKILPNIVNKKLYTLSYTEFNFHEDLSFKEKKKHSSIKLNKKTVLQSDPFTSWQDLPEGFNPKKLKEMDTFLCTLNPDGALVDQETLTPAFDNCHSIFIDLEKKICLLSKRYNYIDTLLDQLDVNLKLGFSGRVCYGHKKKLVSFDNKSFYGQNSKNFSELEKFYAYFGFSFEKKFHLADGAIAHTIRSFTASPSKNLTKKQRRTQERTAHVMAEKNKSITSLPLMPPPKKTPLSQEGRKVEPQRNYYEGPVPRIKKAFILLKQDKLSSETTKDIELLNILSHSGKISPRVLGQGGFGKVVNFETSDDMTTGQLNVNLNELAFKTILQKNKAKESEWGSSTSQTRSNDLSDSSSRSEDSGEYSDLLEYDGESFDYYDSQTSNNSKSLDLKKSEFDRAKEELKKEAEILQELQGEEHIIPFYAFSGGNNPIIIMKKMDGSLKTKEFADNISADVKDGDLKGFIQMASSVQTLQEKGYTHYDIKPDNFLIDNEKNIFLSDFGLSKKSTGDHSRGAGSPNYKAPEMMEESIVDVNKVDVYSLGRTFAELLINQPTKTSMERAMFFDREMPRILDSYKEAPKKKLSELILEMIDQDPGKRPTISEVKRRLKEI